MTHHTDSVEIPHGAARANTWQPFDDELYRTILGRCMSVAGRDDVTVQSTAIQFNDGGICATDDVIEAPKVYITGDGDRGLTSDQARELGKLLIIAADQADSWIGVGSTEAVTR